MGRLVPPIPPTHEQYLAGLKEGRDLYQEDLDRFAVNIRRIRRAAFALLVFAGIVAGAIVAMIVLR